MAADSENVAKTDKVYYNYDEAVELTGHGRYNYLLLLACCASIVAFAMDMFGFSIVITVSKCDLQFGLVEAGALASAPFAGIVFAFPWGYYADTRGRRRALILSTSVGFVMAVLSSFSPNWETMLVLKLIGCSFSTAAFTISMTYVGECVGQKKRNQYVFTLNTVNLSSEIFNFGLAYFLLGLDFNVPIPWLGITYRPWRLFTLILATPLGIAALLMLFLQESPKFLANQGENEKAMEALRRMYELNGGKREDFIVKELSPENKKMDKVPFCESLIQQTVPLFRAPLLWRTLQLFFLMIMCCSTNNVFFMWFPTMVNELFNSLSTGASSQTFCEMVVSNMTSRVETESEICVDTISDRMVISGFISGLAFMVLSQINSLLAKWRRCILIAAYLISAVSAILMNHITQPIVGLILFVMLQGTALGIGSVASYFVDLYPTSYRGMVTSLALMVARLISFMGVNVVGAVMTDYCNYIFYVASAFTLSAIFVALFLPSDSAPKKETHAPAET